MVSDSFTQFQISIHALRVEGDFRSLLIRSLSAIFLSTPSGWRATLKRSPTTRKRRGFLSTPSGWRATGLRRYLGRGAPISIHALRVEGDWLYAVQGLTSENFYPRPPGGGRLFDLREPIAAPEIFLSTPSGWRATRQYDANIPDTPISIHALRVEGDQRRGRRRYKKSGISIHALRVEGDTRR